MRLKDVVFKRATPGSETPPSTTQPAPYQLKPPSTNAHIGLAVVCAIIGLIVFPEIFDTIAIILGAYAWKKQNRDTGLYIVILGIVSIWVSVYFTGLLIIDLLP